MSFYLCNGYLLLEWRVIDIKNRCSAGYSYRHYMLMTEFTDALVLRMKHFLSDNYMVMEQTI